jgi:uncharacterized OB-fold protein
MWRPVLRPARRVCELFRRGLDEADVPNDGELVTFTIVTNARPGVQAPYVAAIVDCGGTWVREPT